MKKKYLIILTSFFFCQLGIRASFGATLKKMTPSFGFGVLAAQELSEGKIFFTLTETLSGSLSVDIEGGSSHGLEFLITFYPAKLGGDSNPTKRGRFGSGGRKVFDLIEVPQNQYSLGSYVSTATWEKVFLPKGLRLAKGVEESGSLRKNEFSVIKPKVCTCSKAVSIPVITDLAMINMPFLFVTGSKFEKCQLACKSVLEPITVFSSLVAAVAIGIGLRNKKRSSSRFYRK